MTSGRAAALDLVSSGLVQGENDMKPNVLIAGCLALLILCTCAVAGAQAAELYAEPDAELGEWDDPEVTPTVAVNLTVAEETESAVESYAEPDAALDECDDPEVTPTAAVDPTVVDGAESSSTLMGECTTASKLVTDELEVSDGFDFPVGWPDGDGYRHGTPSDKNGYDFLEWNGKVYHPGEDWNGDSGGDSDFGDPVHAVSNGRVVAAKFYKGNLGNVTVIEHRLQDGTNVWSQYAHLNEMFVKVNDPVNRGDKIGTIGKGGNNTLPAHLHFEIRKNDLPPNAWPDDKSEEEVLKNYFRPSDFINTHRPDPEVTPTPGSEVTISASVDEDLLDYLDELIPDVESSPYFNDDWGITRDQYKIMIATLIWAEAGQGGYTAHSSASSDSVLHNDLGNDFRFSTGIGPLQIDNGGPDSNDPWEKWPTIKKLDYKKALESALEMHLKKNADVTFLKDIRNKTKNIWFAYYKSDEHTPVYGRWEVRWSEATGLDWSSSEGCNKDNHLRITWSEVKGALSNNAKSRWEKYDDAVQPVGSCKWVINADDEIETDTKDRIILDKCLPTYLIIARNGQMKYYYAQDEDQNIEIWAYCNPDEENYHLKSIFIRDYSTGRFPEGRSNGKAGDTLDHNVVDLNPTSNNVDVVLVIDRSGSMSGSPISNAKNSAKQFIALMEDGDKAGVVSFDTYARYDYQLTTLTKEEKVKEDIQKKIDSIYVSGATAIGRGLRYALDDLLNYGDPNDSWAIVLLSDGYHNSGEHPDKVIPSIKDNNIPVYTIGLGFVDEALMKRISEQTGGEYYPTPTEKDLHQIYEKIAAKVRGLGTAGEFTAKMGTGDVLSVPVKIDSSMKKAIFSTSWPGSNVDLILHRPDGSMIDPSVAASDPAIEYSSGSTYKIYKVTDPEPGTWNMNLTATDMPAGGEDVYVTVRAESTLSMSLSTDNGQYNQGEIVKIVANLSDAGTQITGADVNVNITLPDSNIEQLTLYDDGRHGDGEAQDGVYANYFTNTSLKGDYKVDATSTGSLSGGSLFTRIEEVSFEIIPGTSLISLSPESLSVDGKTGEQITRAITISTSSSSMLVSITPLLLQSKDGDVIDTGNIEVNPGSVNVSSGVPEDVLVTIKIPADTTSGDYTGKIVATSTGGSDFCTINLHVTKGVTEPTSSDSSGDDSSVSTGSALAAGGGASFSFAGLPVSTITIESEADISRALIIAERVRSLPGSITPPEPETYQYLAITPYRLEDADFDEATISFHVPVGYLSAMGKETTDVALMRYVDGQWVRLKTTLIKEEGGRAYYEAESPGLSVLAIVLEKDGAAVAAPGSSPAPVAAVEEEEEKEGEDPDVVEPEVSLTSTPTPAAASAATPTPKEAPVIYAPIGLVIAGLLAFALRRRE